MKDLAAHTIAVVRDELAKQAAIHGVDKNEFGYVIGGFGAIGIVLGDNGQPHVLPRWTLAISLRSRLIGYPPLAGGLPIPDILPSDDKLRQAVARTVAGIVAERDRQFAEASGANAA